MRIPCTKHRLGCCLSDFLAGYSVKFALRSPSKPHCSPVPGRGSTENCDDSPGPPQDLPGVDKGGAGVGCPPRSTEHAFSWLGLAWRSVALACLRSAGPWNREGETLAGRRLGKAPRTRLVGGFSYSTGPSIGPSVGSSTPVLDPVLTPVPNPA